MTQDVVCRCYMKVEIWSDIMCPFCYIGKRKFEAALEQFSRKDEVEVVWHSFQLNPDMVDQPGKSAIEYLAEVKNQSIEWSQEMHNHVTESAKKVGLKYHFDKVKIANPESLPFGMVLDKYDNLWAAQHVVDGLIMYDPYNNRITEVAIPTEGSFTQFVIADDNGDVWFVEPYRLVFSNKQRFILYFLLTISLTVCDVQIAANNLPPR